MISLKKGINILANSSLSLNLTNNSYIKITKINNLTLPDLYDFNTFTFTSNKEGNIGISLNELFVEYDKLIK